MPNTPGQTERLEIIGSAAAGIAHDINNQLTLIVNHLSLNSPDAAIEAALVSALAAVDRCAALTNSLLAYARGGAVVLQPVDPGAFVRKFLSELTLPEGVILVARVPPSLPPIAADPLTLERALANLVLNACTAMNNSGTLRVSVWPQKIQITDSGPGIPPEIASRIFEPFFTTKGTDGNGLGLSIVREIMRQHCGSATVRSEPGCGARFTLRFRAAYRRTFQGTTGFKASPRIMAPAA